MRVFLLLFFSILLTASTIAQTSLKWKRMRYEVFMGTGVTNFLGELGGADREGTNFLRDLEFSMTRPVISLGIRYRIIEKISTKIMLNYGFLHGDDKTTTEKYRLYRNLNFRSQIAEISAHVEYSIIKEKQGHRYNLRRVRGLSGFKTNTYFFLGVGGFYFNPKGNDSTGKWVALQPLGTEGQGMVPTRKKYSRFALCIPYGIGFKYGIGRRTNIGLEFGARKTFTDYIDDVSATYFDNQLIKEQKGAVAAYLADPSSRTTGQTAVNQQRGDSRNNDSYMFMTLNLTIKLYTTRQGLPKFR